MVRFVHKHSASRRQTNKQHRGQLLYLLYQLGPKKINLQLIVVYFGNMQVEDDNNYWDNGGGRRIRKVLASSEIVLPDAKRQMSTNSPSSAMEISAMPQDVPAMPSADDVLVQVSVCDRRMTQAQVLGHSVMIPKRRRFFSPQTTCSQLPNIFLFSFALSDDSSKRRPNVRRSRRVLPLHGHSLVEDALSRLDASTASCSA